MSNFTVVPAEGRGSVKTVVSYTEHRGREPRKASVGAYDTDNHLLDSVGLVQSGQDILSLSESDSVLSVGYLSGQLRIVVASNEASLTFASEKMLDVYKNATLVLYKSSVENGGVGDVTFEGVEGTFAKGGEYNVDLGGGTVDFAYGVADLYVVELLIDIESTEAYLEDTIKVTGATGAELLNSVKVNNLYGIEFVKGASNGGGDNGYYQLIGPEELLSTLPFHNAIKIAVQKDAATQSYLNQVNWFKGEDGGDVDLSCSDGSDIIQRFPKLYCILGGKNDTYDRFIFSDAPFTYDGEEAQEYELHGETPDYTVIVNSQQRSLYDESVEGTQTGGGSVTGIDQFKDAHGQPKTQYSRFQYEQYARNRNEDTDTYIPYCNALSQDLELLMGLMYVECRTKALNGVFGHGISSNSTPSASTWGTISGVRITEADGTQHYYAFSSTAVYHNGSNSNNVWALINGQCPLLKMFEVQRDISNGCVEGTFESVYNTDGGQLQGLSDGVMTGIWTRLLSGKLSCAFNSTDEDAECDIEICLRQPVWRGRNRLWGHLWTRTSGMEVLCHLDEDGNQENILYRAKRIEDLTHDTDTANKTSKEDWPFVGVYEEIGDIGHTNGWCPNALVCEEGKMIPTGIGTGASVLTYESAYNYFGAGTAGYYVRRYAIFGGSAINGFCVLRCCDSSGAPSNTSTYSGSGFRVRLTA